MALAGALFALTSRATPVTALDLGAARALTTGNPAREATIRLTRTLLQRRWWGAGITGAGLDVVLAGTGGQ